ncbi:DUF397 domain-containing protein [Streptomyces sp. NPDC012421]|uniref:DUF397 domain-containing protein n=1 Tax=Streptomyces sp. NPDC012421 TaxID=3364832 RepID=UPI0036E4208D
MSSTEWRKSSYSGNTGGDCVEVAPLAAPHVAVRDSKDTSRPHLRATSAAFAVFVEAAARGRI